MNIKIVLAGVGGQGVLFATKIISETAADLGFDIIGSETHGMSQRGGSVASFLKIGDFAAPLVMQGEADFLYGFNADEALRNLACLKKGGICFADALPSDFTPNINGWIAKRKIIIRTIPAGEISLKLESPKSANLVLLGFSAAQPESPFKSRQLRETIKRLSPAKFLPANLKCFDAGLTKTD